jgi:DNA polymerase
MTEDQDVDTRFELDDRQRAMLAEMGVRVWMPKTQQAVVASPPVAAQSLAPETAPLAVASPPAPKLVSMPVVDISALPEGIAKMDWGSLQSAVSTCTGCGLCQGRQQAILGEGLQTADWMVVGDAPGEEEDKEGVSFAGPAGQLLDNMIKALEIGRAHV